MIDAFFVKNINGEAHVYRTKDGTYVRRIGANNVVNVMNNQEYASVVYSSGVCIVYKLSGAIVHTFSDGGAKQSVVSGNEVIITYENGRSKVYSLPNGVFVRNI